MMGSQCPTCQHYQGDLTCEAFPRNIPELILTGEFDHTKPLGVETNLRLYEPRRDDLEKAQAGPFIGPRGGKWADPQLSIPWHDTHVGGAAQRVVPESPFPPGHTPKEHVEIARATREQHVEALPKTLEKIRSVVGDAVKIKGRVKELGSALKKIIRKPKYGTADKLQDWTGTRVIHESVDQVKATVEKLRRFYKVITEDNYIDRPQGHYRSHHLILETENGLQFEIQVRTKNQDTFAEWSHHVYKPTNEIERKFQDDPQVLEYEAQISDYFWSRDNGRDADKPPCIPVVANSFGCL
jgi:hypothetical protein